MSKPLFTTKHYKAIASWLKRLDRFVKSRNEYEDLANEFMDFFAKDNPKFNKFKFWDWLDKS